MSRADVLVEQLFGAAIGALELFGVYLGDRLGLYAAPRRRRSGDARRAVESRLHS